MKKIGAFLLAFASILGIFADDVAGVRLNAVGATVERMENGCWRVFCPPGSSQADLTFTGVKCPAEAEVLV